MSWKHILLAVGAVAAGVAIFVLGSGEAPEPSPEWERLRADALGSTPRRAVAVPLFDAIDEALSEEESISSLVAWHEAGGQVRERRCGQSLFMPAFKAGTAAIERANIEADDAQLGAAMRLVGQALGDNSPLIDVAIGMELLSKAIKRAAATGAAPSAVGALVSVPDSLVFDVVVRDAVCLQERLRQILAGRADTGRSLGLADRFAGSEIAEWEQLQLELIDLFKTRLAADGPARAFKAFAGRWREKVAEADGDSLIATLMSGPLAIFEKLEEQRVAFERFAAAPRAGRPASLFSGVRHIKGRDYALSFDLSAPLTEAQREANPTFVRLDLETLEGPARVVGLGRTSVLYAMGLRNGDVVQAPDDIEGGLSAWAGARAKTLAVRRGGEDLVLHYVLPASKGGAQLDVADRIQAAIGWTRANAFTISKARLEPGDLVAMWHDAHLVEAGGHDGVTGAAVLAEPGAAGLELGLEAGDVLLAVNGAKPALPYVSALSDAFVRGEGVVEVRLMRGDAPVTLTYTFVD